MPALITHGKVYYKARYYKGGELIGRVGRFRKIALFLWIQNKFVTDKADRVYLKVIYSTDNYNDGYYENMGEFRKAYEIFSSQELINYINGQQR